MWLYRLAKIVLYVPIKILYPTKVYGKKQLPEKRCIVCGNHLSAIDPFFQVIVFKRGITYLSKQELASNWFTKWVFKGLGCVSINRSGSDFTAMKKIIGTLEAERAVALFPEGTRNKTAPGELLEFKSGVSMFALKTGADIMPVIMMYKPKMFRKNYMLIGDVIKVEKPEGRITSTEIDAFTKEFQCKMEKQYKELKTRVANLQETKKENR